MDLLLTTKEPLTSFDGIKSSDVRELIVDNEGNLDTWRNARKAVQALGLSEEVKALLGAWYACGAGAPPPCSAPCNPPPPLPRALQRRWPRTRAWTW
jgi:hypothetical protein